MDLYSATSQQSNLGKPSKACNLCGGTIVWRRRLAANWNRVLYCSASCRRISVAKARSAHRGQVEVCDHSAVESVASAA